MPHILLVKTSSMGDVIHNLAVIADIRAHHPSATFDWLVEESFAEIPALHTDVKNVITVAVRRWRKQLLSKQTWLEINAVKLQSVKYDAVIDTQGLIKSAVLTWLTGGETHGMNQATAREPLASVFYRHTYNVPRNLHAVTRNRMLVALALNYPVPNQAPDYGFGLVQHASSTANGYTLPTKFAVCLHATSRDSKLWPHAHWVTLGQHLQQQGFSMVLPWANATEKARAELIAKQVEGAVVLPKLGLKMLASIIAQANIAIGVDTGLMHLATALNVPSLAIYTDTDPNLTGLYPGNKAHAINLGGKAQTPSPQLVLKEAVILLNR
jgi:heptosyltransferase I